MDPWLFPWLFPWFVWTIRAGEEAFFQIERDKFLSGEIGAKLNDLTKDLTEKQNKFDQLIGLDKQRKEKISKELTNDSR